MSNKLKSLLETASKEYYAGRPIMSDAEFDLLEEKLGEQLLVGEKDSYIPHTFRMYSLNKHYPERDGSHELMQSKNTVRTPKLDGLASSLLYVNGSLAQALTRGDGHKGRPITDKAAVLVPNELSELGGVVQVTGEMVADIDVEHSRNAASGSFGLDKGFEARAKEIGLVFVAYDIISESLNFDTYTEKLQFLSSLGFETILTVDASKYPTDGEVIRMDNEAAFKNLGYTDKFPRGAIAIKTVSEVKSTKLLDVIWQTGSSGRITPVAILEPLELGDATISRATLNNIAYIRALDLELGDMVDVVRSGEIIPKIVGKTQS